MDDNPEALPASAPEPEPPKKKKPRRVSILRKGLTVLAIPLLYQAVFIALLLKRQHDLNGAQSLAMHTKDVMAKMDRIYLQLVTQHSNLRAYVITGNPLFEAEISGAERKLRNELDQLRFLIRDSPKQQARLNRLTTLAEQQLDYEKKQTDLVRANDRNAAVTESKTLEGKQIMDTVRGEIEDFRSHEEELDRQRLEAMQRSSQGQTWLLVGGMIVNIGVGALAAGMFSREIGARVRAVAENTRRFTRGEKLPPIVTGTDEIHELDEQFHIMVERLGAARFRERVYQETLERRAEDLGRANRDLSQKNQEIEMFVFSVSHDLRSPLVNLQGFGKELGMARKDLQQISDEGFPAESHAAAKTLIERDITESLHFIQTAVTRLSAIIDALLRLSRAGRVEYRPRLVDLQTVVGRIVEAMQGTITAKEVAVTVQELAPAWADPTAIEQVFANLIGNAVNYLDPKRAGKIEIGMADRKIPELEKALIYFVADNGLGIPEAYMPKVFAIFQRLHGAVAPGEGVGLALVRRMVERHGGKIWVESVEGAGSTFLVALPATKEVSPLAGVAPKKESVSVRPRFS